MFGQERIITNTSTNTKKNIVSKKYPIIVDYEMPSLTSKSTIIGDTLYNEYNLCHTNCEKKDEMIEYQFKSACFNPNKVFSPNVFVTQLQKRITLQEGKSSLLEELEEFIL